VLVTGMGGPSGTGKRPLGEPVLPAPVFIQESSKATAFQQIKASAGSLGYSSSGEPVESQPDRQGYQQSTKEPSNDNLLPPSGSSASGFKEEETNPSEVPSSSSSATTVPLSEEVGFNGLTINAVFPVPVSSLKITVWAVVLKDYPQPNLSINPFGQVLFPFSELLNLTLPPVDANSFSLSSKLFSDESRVVPSLVVNEEESHKLIPNSSNWSRSVEPLLHINGRSADQHVREGNHISNGAVGQNNDITGLQKGGPVLTSSFSALKQLFPGVNLAYGGVPSNK
jgi:hypothetical protein